MNNKIIVFSMLIPFMMLSGCISESIEKKLEEEPEMPEEYQWEDDGELVIVTYDVTGLTDSMLSEFENQTGYEISITKLEDAGSILSHLLQYKGVQVSDLAIGLDNTYLQTAIDNGVLWEHFANFSNISESALTPYSGPLAVPFDQGYMCLNYDTEIVDGENMSVPTSLWDLTEDDWNGKVAIPSPETSSPGRAFMTATVDYFANDEDTNTEWTDWWTAMAENDAIITTGWSEAYETHYTGGYGEYTEGYVGDAHVVVSYCHSPGVEAWYNGNWTKSAALDLPRAAFHQVEYAAAIEGGNLDAASAFIEYLLSEEVNVNMPTENFMYSVLEDTDLPEDGGYRYHSTIPVQPAEVTAAQIAANMENWLEDWNTAMVAA
ncbi:MAG: hypothetical protein CMB55_06075 [Euryarchaeota archaeon]|nr:hypothetical protein [Euryarchaeota archaeon]|tara:strand:- start:4423 stop:5553 length:1131 start_codon:yes stop_codon:yes gene_type:complete